MQCEMKGSWCFVNDESNKLEVLEAKKKAVLIRRSMRRLDDGDRIHIMNDWLYLIEAKIPYLAYISIQY